jgi:hypothetical protein
MNGKQIASLLLGGEESMEISTERYIELEDEAIRHYVSKHNEYLAKINEIGLDNAPSLLIAKAEYWYAWAQIYASNIAGYYRKQQKLYEARAEMAQADGYEAARTNKDGRQLNGSTDGQYLSRKAKGKQLEKAAHYEGNYIRWSGIAKSYGDAINSLKDIIKSIEKEKKGDV